MAKILVKTPVTSNGRDVVMDGGKILYRDTILMAAARPILEKMNATLPAALKKIITDITEDGMELKKSTTRINKNDTN